MPATTTRPNWLLRSLMIFSLGVHGLLFAYLTDIYRPRSLHFIELTMRDMGQQAKRRIPRPRQRQRSAVRAQAIRPTRVSSLPMPPKPPAPVKTAPSMPSEIAPPPAPTPEVPVADDVKVSNWQPVTAVKPQSATPSVAPDKAQALSSETELSAYKLQIKQMIDLKAGQAYKRSRAKKRQIQGRTMVKVVIETNGSLSMAKVEQSSGNSILDRTALKAVNEAAPFPRPPAGAITVTIPIAFKLI